MAPPSQPSSDRRAFSRVPHRVRAVLSTRHGEVTAEVVDLSVGGLGVEITGELRNNDFVRILLPLAPDDDSSEWVDPDALVTGVHGTTASGQTRLGLSFFQMPKATLRRIAAIVAKRLEEQPKVRDTAPAPEPKRPTPAATVPPPASKATTRELPKVAPAAIPARSVTPKRNAPAKPKAPPAKPKAPPAKPKAPPTHIPRTSARELRTLFHEALASLEEDGGGNKKKKS